MKNPCVRDCPKRSSTCHSECKDYLDFREENNERGKEQRKKAIAAEFQITNVNKAISKKQRKTKVKGVRHE